MSNATISTFPTFNQGVPPLSSLAPAHTQSSSNMSPLTAILSLLILIAIPAFIYAFFFAINCPRIPLRRFNRSSSGVPDAADFNSKVGHLELVSGMKYAKEEHGEEYGSECPVCLSVFVEGDYVRQLNACKHSFHVACIDKWLYSHSSCPVCRASVPIKRPKKPVQDNEQDLQQGLPDATSLV